MTRVLLDSSSAILLFKADLFDALIKVYHVSMPQSVLHELTFEDYPGADAFFQYTTLKKIKIVSVEYEKSRYENSLNGQSSLHKGERDTIGCFQAGGYDFIITDDGRAARYCRQNDIPFINALLFPRVLYYLNKSSLQESNNKMGKLISLGRYSAKVVKWAENCKKEALYFAIPAISE